MGADGNVIQGDFAALGHAGSGSFVGLEIIHLNDVLSSVAFSSDEFTAVCPVTGQPDQYELTIELEDTLVSIESKSLKIYLNEFRNKGAFAESLCATVKKDVVDAIDKALEEKDAIFHEEQCTVTIVQKRRGGIEIAAVI